MNGGFWRGKRVLVTGHTGFKGGWLSLWLQSLGAEVAGYALPPTPPPPPLDRRGWAGTWPTPAWPTSGTWTA